MKRYVLLVALLVMLGATEAKAISIISFDELPGSNLDPFLSYEEDGYLVSATSGRWYVATHFGSPVPAIVGGPLYTPDESTITVTEGGAQFTFQGLELTSNVAGGTTYTIEGFQSFIVDGGAPLFTEMVTITNINTFNIFDTSPVNSLMPVRRVEITGTPGTGTTSFNIDNIRAGIAPRCDDPNGCQPLPEPASMMLLGAGLAGIGIWRRRAAR